MSSSPRWHAQVMAARRETFTYEQLGVPSLLFNSPVYRAPSDNGESEQQELSPPSYEHAVQRQRAPRPMQPVYYSFVPKHGRIEVEPSDRTLHAYYLHFSKSGSGDAYTTSMVLQCNGQVIGDFELGYTQKSGTVALRGQHSVITEVLTRSCMTVGRGVPWKERQRTALRQIWQWKPPQYTKRIFWDVTDAGTMKCYSSNTWDRAVLLASFHYSSASTKIMEVSPEGYDQLDDILISAFILERWKLEMVI